MIVVSSNNSKNTTDVRNTLNYTKIDTCKKNSQSTDAAK